MPALDELMKGAVADAADRFDVQSMPADLGLRALACAHRRARRMRMIVVSMVVVLAVGLTSGAVAIRQALRPPVPVLPVAPFSEEFIPGGYLISGYWNGSGWKYLNPATGEFRSPPYGSSIQATSPDLRYVAVSLSKTERKPERSGILDAVTGKVIYEWDETSRALHWSPNGRWIAGIHTAGSMESRHADKISLLDVTTGRTETIDLDFMSHVVMTWSQHSDALYFHGTTTKENRYAYYRVSIPDGRVQFIKSEMSNYYDFKYPDSNSRQGTDRAILAPKNKVGDWAIIDLATGRTVDRLAPPDAIYGTLWRSSCVFFAGFEVAPGYCGGPVTLIDPLAVTVTPLLNLPASIKNVWIMPAPRSVTTSPQFRFSIP